MSLARNIRYLRKKQGWGQDLLAEKLEYKSYTTIQKWESGVSEPPLKVVHELAALFHVDVNDLINCDLENDSHINSSSPLTSRDQKDIAKSLAQMMSQLEDGSDLMFDGDPMSDEARESIRQALQMGLEIAKVKNKERFTPHKYRKG